jgi:hypothetical protein
MTIHPDPSTRYFSVLFEGLTGSPFRLSISLLPLSSLCFSEVIGIDDFKILLQMGNYHEWLRKGFGVVFSP